MSNPSGLDPGELIGDKSHYGTLHHVNPLVSSQSYHNSETPSLINSHPTNEPSFQDSGFSSNLQGMISTPEFSNQVASLGLHTSEADRVHSYNDRSSLAPLSLNTEGSHDSIPSPTLNLNTPAPVETEESDLDDGDARLLDNQLAADLREKLLDRGEKTEWENPENLRFWWLFVAGVFIRLHSKSTESGDDPKTDEKSMTHPLSCSHCGATFQRLHQLRRHQSLHLRKHNKVYCCIKCSEQFSFVSKLRNHVCSSIKSEIKISDVFPNLKQVVGECDTEEEENLNKEDNLEGDEGESPNSDFNDKSENDPEAPKSTTSHCTTCLCFKKRRKRGRKPKTIGQGRGRPRKQRKQSSPKPIIFDEDDDVSEEVTQEDVKPSLDDSLGMEESTSVVDGVDPAGDIDDDDDFDDDVISSKRRGRQKLRRNKKIKKEEKENRRRGRPRLSRSPKDVEEKTSSSKKDLIKKKCTYCDRMYSSIEKLVNHEAMHCCKECPETFKTITEAKSHEWKVHKVSKHSCHICGKLFNEARDIKRHLIIHNEKRPFQCPTCDKGFHHKSNLKLHMAIHAGTKEHLCEICSKRFTHPSGLLRHKKHVHLKLKSHVCKFCGRMFPERSKLLIHERIHTGEMPFPCIVCNEKFRTQQSLNNHMQAHTGVKAYSCLQCSKSFTTKQSYKDHLQLHQGTKLFQCEDCKKSFATYTYLRAHRNHHHKDGEKRPHMCPICGKGFRYPHLMRDHHRRKHENNPGPKKPKKVRKVRNGMDMTLGGMSGANVTGTGVPGPPAVQTGIPQGLAVTAPPAQAQTPQINLAPPQHHHHHSQDVVTMAMDLPRSAIPMDQLVQRSMPLEGIQQRAMTLDGRMHHDHSLPHPPQPPIINPPLPFGGYWGPPPGHY